MRFAVQAAIFVFGGAAIVLGLADTYGPLFQTAGWWALVAFVGVPAVTGALVWARRDDAPPWEGEA